MYKNRFEALKECLKDILLEDRQEIYEFPTGKIILCAENDHFFNVLFKYSFFDETEIERDLRKTIINLLYCNNYRLIISAVYFCLSSEKMTKETLVQAFNDGFDLGKLVYNFNCCKSLAFNLNFLDCIQVQGSEKEELKLEQVFNMLYFCACILFNIEIVNQ